MTVASSHLESRLDLSVRFRNEGGADKLHLIGTLPPVSATWRRNRPGEADELSVDLMAEQIPWDLRILKGAVVDHWLFEHRDRARCMPGDPGHFSGMVDTISRNPETGRVTLSARDWTGLALGTKVPESVLATMTLSRPVPLEVLVHELLTLMPGGAAWRIESLTPLGQAPVAPPEVKPAPAPKKGAQKKLAAVAKGPNVGQMLPAGDTTVWGAVHELCVRHGVVPEVSVGRDGHRVVTLVTAQDLQTSTVLRPFSRDGETVRYFREGDCKITSEELELTTSSKLPDFVDVSSTNPVTGATLTARWPSDEMRGGDPKDRSNGTFQTIDGVTSLAELQRMARDAFQALAHNQFRVTIDVPHPWSSGGGPRSPDLLDLTYGAGAMVVRRPTRPLSQLLARQGVEAAMAARLVDEDAAFRDFGLCFQVVDVEHKWGSAAYSCTVNLRQFLGLGNFAVIGRGATDVDLRAQGAA